MEDRTPEAEEDSGAGRILIADDHEPTRSKLKKVFEGEPDFEVVAEASNGREAVKLCSEARPDLVLMDVRMPGMDGIEATRRIKARHPRTVVLMVTAFEDPDYLLEALEAGAAGYVLKHAEPEEFLRAVRKALSGEFPMDTDLSSRLLRNLVGEGRVRGAEETPDPPTEVVRVWLLDGFRVSVGDRTIGEDGWRLRKAGSLVKLLALAEGHRLHREEITALLWPDLEAKRAANNLHHALHFARGALEPANITSRYLTLRGDMLALCPDGPLWVDVEAFEGAAEMARRTREPAAYRAAIELYAGDLLPEDRYEGWAEGRRRELRTMRLALLVELAGLYEEREEFDPAIEALREAVADERTNEEAHLGLMRLYAATGERQKALLQYGLLQQVLSEDLEIEPDTDTKRLHEEISADRFPPARSEGHPPEEGADGRHNLPNAHSSFVGREREMLEIKRLLSMTQLLTLTGTGGSGKTRLALEVARDLVGAYPDGVWLAELAPIADPALVPQAVAKALDVGEQPGRPLADTLSDALRRRRTLIILDNCEHLADASARLVDMLLEACPGLRILATSREALGVAGEVNWLALPLTAPDEGRLPPVGDLARYEAVRLFLERTRSRLPAFELTAENAGAVVEACRKLEGIPLAIELASARVATLAVEQVAERLNDSLKLLTLGGRTADPRHQTMRATLDWSHDLLDEAERKLLRRLSVFAGGWTLEAAESVGAEGRDDEMDLLGRLVEKSLVVAEAKAEGVMRYRMLEPIRQYAREKLEESGELEQVRGRHARRYLALGEAAEPELIRAGQLAWLERLETEYGNLRAALDWCLGEEGSGERAETGLRLAGALGRFWSTQGPGEGRRWLERGIAKSGASSKPLRAKALVEAGFIAVYQGDPGCMALLDESLALYKELGDRSGTAIAISHLGHAVAHLEDHERIRTLREEAEALLTEPLDKRGAAHLLLFLGIVAQSERDHEQVIVRMEEALALFREFGDLRGAAMSLTTLGMDALERKDAARAAEAFTEDLRLLRELKDKVGIVYGLLGIAAGDTLRGGSGRAARFFGAAEILREEIGHPPLPLERAHYDYESYVAAARAGLDEESFNEAWSEGRAMSAEQAIEYALGTGKAARAERADFAGAGFKPARAGTPDTLTRREREVALLAARNLTNRRIAEELSISEHTVANHLRKILDKLGLRSRAQISSRL
ncbi:MAG: response regulator [Rubrobacteraceae bacterium]